MRVYQALIPANIALSVYAFKVGGKAGASRIVPVIAMLRTVLNRSTIRIVRPDGEGPVFVADEVGVEIGDAEVVNLCELFGRADRHDGNKFAGKGRQFITGRQFARRCPALAQHVERMLGRRPDYMARDV